VRLRTLTSLLLVLAACVAAGCGSDEEPKPSIPSDFTAAFNKELASVEARFDFGDGACNDIAGNQRTVNDLISKLPSSVDSDVRNALQDSFDHLFDLTSSQCDEDKGQNTDTETTTTETQTTETQTTETQTTESTNTETTPTDTTPTDTVPTTPPDTGGDDTSGGAQGPGS
jgi:hypothetical protein